MLAELIKWGHQLNAKYRFDQKKWNIIKHKSLSSHARRREKSLTFGDTEIEENKFQYHKIPIPLEDGDIEKVLVSNKISCGEKIIILYWLLV